LGEKDFFLFRWPSKRTKNSTQQDGTERDSGRYSAAVKDVRKGRKAPAIQKDQARIPKRREGKRKHKNMTFNQAEAGQGIKEKKYLDFSLLHNLRGSPAPPAR